MRQRLGVRQRQGGGAGMQQEYLRRLHDGNQEMG